MSIADDLLATSQAQVQRKVLAAAPKSYRPGDVKENEDGTSTVTSNPSQEPNPKHDQLLIEHGYDPERDMIVGPINSRSWNVYRPYEYRQLTAPRGPDETQEAYDERLDQAWKGKFYYHRFNTVPRPNGETKSGIEDLVKSLDKWRPPAKPKRAPVEDGAFIFAVGDTQLGKLESPTSEVVAMFKRHVDECVAEYQTLRNRPAHVHIAWTGDCLEGQESQGGRNRWRTVLTMTEQVRVLQRLMIYSIKAFAPHCERLTVISVPGNHDEAARRDLATRMDDSWAIQALVSVEDALKLSENPALEKIECYVPGPDQQGVTLNVGGATIAHVHGHQFRIGKEYEWWKGQAFGGQDEGQADILLHGHQHHYQVEEDGHRTRICTPAMEKESVWWKHKTGTPGSPGSLIIHVENGRPSMIRRLR